MVFGKHINKYYFKYGIYFILGIVALILVDWYQLKIPEIFGEIIDGLKEGTLTRGNLSSFMREMFIITVIMFTGRFFWRICLLGNGAKIESDLRAKMFAHAEKLSQTYFQENKTGAQMALYTNDLQTIRMVFGQGILMIVDAIFLGVLAIVKMWKMSISLTIISTVPLIILALCGGIIGKFMQKKYEARQKSYADISDFTQESFSGIAVIKAFVKEGKELISFSKKNKRHMEENVEFVKSAMLLQILVGFLIGLVMVIIAGYGSYLVYKDPVNFTVGNLTTYAAFFGHLIWPMLALAQLFNIISQGKASLKRINSLLDQVPEVADRDVVDVANIEGKITFQNLTFKYPKTDLDVLKNINMEIKRGEHVGLIGRTGSGKTTIVDLLLHIYNVDDHTLFIDDIDIMKIPLKTLRNHVAYVPQDNFLFSDTIENNIKFGKNNATKTDVERAAILADLETNIKDFPLGYQTMLGERGVTISGGQKQRTSIARAIIKDAPILILDDSVSAVDTKTEETILDNLKRVRAGKTTILIAHRISTVQNLDKIILIDDGEIVGIGTHEQLLKLPLYANMVHMQTLENEVGGAV